MYLTFSPGNNGENAYGPEPEAFEKPVVIPIVAAFVVFAGVQVYSVMKLQEATQKAAVAMQEIEQKQQELNEELRKLEQVDVSLQEGSHEQFGQDEAAGRETAAVRVAAGKMLAEDFFGSRSVSITSQLKTNLKAFKATCGRLPTAQEGVSVLAVGAKASGCTGWTGSSQDLAADNIDFPLYFQASGTNQVTLYTYGKDGQPGGEGENKDYRMDISL